MPEVGILALAVVLGVAVLTDPNLRRATAVTVTTWLVVPAPLVIPNPMTSALTVHRFVLLALVIAVLRRPARSDAPGPVGVVVAALAVFVGGVVAFGFLGPATADPATAIAQAGRWVDHLVTVLVLLAAARRIDDAAFWLRTLVGVGLLVAAVAVAEAVSGRAFGQWLFADLGSQAGLDAAAPLEQRGGSVRVRAGAEFALEFAWIAVALWPAALMLADRFRRGATGPVWGSFAIVAAVALPVAVLLSQTRSAIAILPLVLLAWAVLSRPDPPVGRAAAVIALVVITAPLAAATLTDTGIDQGSVEVRQARLELLTEQTAASPWTGLGLGAVQAIGLATTDASYLHTYAELGVTGLVLLVAVLVLGIGALLPAVTAPVDDPSRRLAITALLGATTVLAGSAAYDALTLMSSARLLWVLLVTGGVAAARAAPAWPGLAHRSTVRVASAALIVTLGTLYPALVTTPAAVAGTFSTLPVALEVGAGDPVVPYGRTYTATVCRVLTEVAQDAGATARCRDAGDAAGWGRFRVQASTVAQVTAVIDRVRTDVTSSRAVPNLAFHPVGVPDRAAPTSARTAPLWVPILAVIPFLLPRTRRPAGGPRPVAAHAPG